jgi:AcrR family transcriptional regulator
MVGRKYEQRLRAESAEETRRRILATFAEQLRNSPTHPISLDAIARHAKVARSTIYTVFGSKAGLFDAFVEDLWSRTGLTTAVSNPDARDHLRAGITAACRMYAADRGVYRVLFSLNQLQPDAVGMAVQKMEKERSGGMAHLARRLDEDSALRADVSVERATDVLWMLCSFDTFDSFYSERGKSVDETIELIVDTAERAVCRPGE